MTNVMAIEMMSDEQLDQVSGGTCQETDELIDLIGEVRKVESRGKKSYRKLHRWEVADHLEVHYGIIAETHCGFLFFSDGAKNTYRNLTGKSLTHMDVITRIVGEDRIAHVVCEP